MCFKFGDKNTSVLKDMENNIRYFRDSIQRVLLQCLSLFISFGKVKGLKPVSDWGPLLQNAISAINTLS